MFDNLSSKLTAAMRTLKGNGRITDINVAATVKEIRRALMDAGEPIWRKRRVVVRIDVAQADEDKERHHQQLDDDHDRVGGRALARAAQQQPGPIPIHQHLSEGSQTTGGGGATAGYPAAGLLAFDCRAGLAV